MRKIFTVLALSLVTSVANAQMYWGANLTIVDLDGVDPWAGVFRIGQDLNPNFAVEGRLGIGLKDDDDVEVDHVFGVYAKGKIPVAGSVKPYGLIGWTSGEVSGPGGSADESDISFGVGVDIAMSKTYGLNVEWAQLIDKDGFEATGLSFGATFRF